MPDRCKQCDAALTERDAFCTKCGARREPSNESAAAPGYCTKCGATLGPQTKFCVKCGAAAEISGAGPHVEAEARARVSGAEGHPAVNATAGGVKPQINTSGSATLSVGIPTAAILGAGIVVLALVVAVAAGLISAAHRTREKARELKASETIEKATGNFAAGGKDASRKSSPSPGVDVNKNLANLQAAANALSQNTAQQGGTNRLNSAPGIVGAASGSAPEVGSMAPTGSKSAAADAAAAIAATNSTLDAALNSPPMPKADPVVPVAATGNQAHDWALRYERTVGGPEADLMVRTGDINNLGFGWPQGFDPFSGKSTPVHPWPDPDKIPLGAPDGTDRIMLGTSVMPIHMVMQRRAGQAEQMTVESVRKGPDGGDGYSGSLSACFQIQDRLLMELSGGSTARLNQLPTIIPVPETLAGINSFDASECARKRQLTLPTPIVLSVGALPSKINAVLMQIFADDFQPVPTHSHFQVSLNGTRIPNFEYAINALDQSGPIGKLLTLKLLPEYWPLLKSGEVKLLIDDPTTDAGDGYAVDFVRILVNPHKLPYEVSLSAHVVDADKHTPIAGATVTAALESAATDKLGKCEFAGLPAGLVVATAAAPDYDENSTPVDLPAGQKGQAEIQLHRHLESTAALERSIAQTGSATIYGIRFDTNSSKLRPDSLPALNAVLGLFHDHPGSNWIISGHTDNQGNVALNQPLSEARAKSVVAWLKQHGADTSRLAPEGFGATRPVADNATVSGRALNRRVEVALAK